MKLIVKCYHVDYVLNDYVECFYYYMSVCEKFEWQVVFFCGVGGERWHCPPSLSRAVEICWLPLSACDSFCFSGSFIQWCSRSLWCYQALTVRLLEFRPACKHPYLGLMDSTTLRPASAHSKEDSKEESNIRSFFFSTYLFLALVF